MDEIDEVKDTETARFNYVSVFVCRGGLFALGPFLPLTGASYIYCNAEAQTTTARDGDGGGGNAASGPNQYIFTSYTSFYCKHWHIHLPKVLLNHRRNFYNSS